MDSKRWLESFAKLLIWAGVVLVWGGPTHLQAQLSCGVSPLPQGFREVDFGARLVGANVEGNQFLLLSRANLAGRNPANNATLFRITLENRDAAAELVASFAPDSVEELATSEDLSRVVLRGRLNPTGQNPDGSLEAFLLNAITGTLTQLTDLAPDQAVFSVDISGDGNTLALISNADLTGENGDGSRELFLLSSGDGIQQLTALDNSSVVSGVSMSRDGQVLAYRVRRNLSGFSDLILVDRTSGISLTLLTAERLEPPFVNADGTQLLIVTSADLTGLNLDGSLEVFRIELNPESLAMGSFEQVSRFDGGVQLAALSADGRVAALRTQGPIGRPGLASYFLLETDSGQVSRLSPLNLADDDQLIFNQDGRRLYLVSTADPGGGNFQRSPLAYRLTCRPSLVRYVPQMGNGQAGNLRFQTNFVFSNTGEDSSIQIEFFNTSGLPLEVNFQDYGRASLFHLPIQAGTPLLVSGDASGLLRAGYAKVSSGPNVSGTAVFTGIRASSNTILYEAAVPLSDPISDFSVVVNTSDDFQTGLAMVNTNTGEDAGAVVEMRLYDDRFNLKATRQLLLPPGHHAASFISRTFEEVPGVDELVGMLTVSSSQPLAVITLRQNDNPRLEFPFKVPTLTTLNVAPGRADQ